MEAGRTVSRFGFGRRLLLAATAVAWALSGAPSEAQQGKTLKWGANREIASLDPYSFGETFTLSVLNHVYEGLVRYTGDLKIEPALAESWETVSPTLWRFKLRQGVKFHNGNPFTADDVLASLARVMHETSPLKGNLPAYKSSRKVDDYTVEIEVNGPYPLLLNDLTNIYILDKEWMEANNALLPTDSGKGVKGYATDNANGTGPFSIASRRADAQTVFVANPNWWDKPKHNIARIEFLPITSAATRVAALLSGEIDFTNVAPLQDLQRLAASPEVKVLQTNELRTVIFAFNLKDKLFESDVTDKNPLPGHPCARGALPRDRHRRRTASRNARIVAQHRRHRGAGDPGYTKEQDERLPFDLEGAKKLLATAGYPNGFSFNFNCQSDSLVNEEEFCQAVAAMWSRAGLKPNLSLGPRSTQTPKRVKGDFDVISFGWANEPMIEPIRS